MKNKKELVLKILKENNYLTLSTCFENECWSAPVVYILDGDLNIYFVSRPNSVHGSHISKNPKVAFSIYDSTQELGDGIGVQASCICEVVSKEDYVIEVDSYVKELKKFEMDLNRYNVYKLSTKQFFIPNEKKWEEEGIDDRLEVIL